MLNLNNIQNLPLKGVLLAHFIFMSWGIQGYWSPDSYLFYNAFFILSLFWAIHQKESDEPVQIALVINVLSILFDVIVLAIYFPESFRSSERFSVAMTILNLVVRPVSCAILCRVSAERGGNYGDFTAHSGLGNVFGGAGGASSGPRTAYDDIDNPSSHQSIPSAVRVDASGNKQPPPYHG